MGRLGPGGMVNPITGMLSRQPLNCGMLGHALETLPPWTRSALCITEACQQPQGYTLQKHEHDDDAEREAEEYEALFGAGPEGEGERGGYGGWMDRVEEDHHG